MSNPAPQKASSVTPIRVTLSARMDFIFFPIEYGALATLLAKHNYTLSARVPISRGGIRFGISGFIAEKENKGVVFDPDKQILGIEGASSNDVASAFKELEQLVVEDLEINLSSSIKFFETISDYSVETGKNPREVLEHAEGFGQLSKSMSEVIGVDVSPFGFRLGSKGEVPNQEEWMDIRVEPVITKADTTYYLALVYRSHSRDKVMKFVEQSGDIIPKIIAVLEQT